MRASQVSALSLFAVLASVVAVPVETETVGTGSADVVLPAEESILTDADVAGHPELFFGEHYGAARSRTTATCKVIPGDKAWPPNPAWDVLDLFVDGKLVKPDPIGEVCYAGPTFNVATCSAVIDGWANSDLHINHPTSIMSPLFQGISCLPGDAAVGRSCTLGGYPVYVVEAYTVWDVQAAVNFARNMNIRLVIKNTGHDFAGKSSGFGSLSIRTHALKGIEVIKKFKSKRYTGPAIKAGSGVQGFEIYAAASAAGLMVVGGEGATVGWGGGYIQGGGHSPLSSIKGMAADHVLAYEVVLANGRLVTANPDSNPDLYWALRGGGGSTFGVVVSVTVKAFLDMPVTISTFTFSVSPADSAKYAAGNFANDDFWAVIKQYLSLFEDHANQGIYSYFNIFPSFTTPGAQTFSMAPYFAPGKSVAQVTALLSSVVAKAEKLGVTLVPNTTAHDGFYSAWQAGFPKEAIGSWNGQLGSRLFPRSNWATPAQFDVQFDAIRELVSSSYLIGFNVAPTLAAGGNPDNAVNPAWRDTLFHAITGVTWDANLRDPAEIEELRKTFTNVSMKKWRDVSPGAGSYLGEADVNEPNFQQAFFGSKYPKLAEVKAKYDPLGVFFAETAVGSEKWKAGDDKLGRLCRI